MECGHVCRSEPRGRGDWRRRRRCWRRWGSRRWSCGQPCTEDGPGWCEALEPRVYRFAFEGQHSEDGLVDTVQWLAPNEAFERFDTESELAECKRPLVR